MLQDTYQEVRHIQLVSKGKPTMSENFIYYLVEKLTVALTERLKLRGDEKGVKMLDCLAMLLMFPMKVKRGSVSGLDDENIVAVVGEVSYLLEFEKE